MSKVKNMRVEIIDDDHVFIDNKQFVSLGRFADAKKDMAKEVKILVDKNYELAKENEALKILLKEQLDNVGDDTSTNMIINKPCKSELDHEWECCGISTEGNLHICKKCGKHIIIGR